jgi:hypothetical protein
MKAWRYKRQWIISLSIILILTLAATIGSTSSSFVDPETSTGNINRVITNWYDLAWGYRKPITINNSGSALTNYQVKVTVNTQTLIGQGKMQSDGDDIRFTQSNGSTEIPYWLESGINTASTIIWVKVPSIPAGNSTLYMYYGNSSASGASSVANTFTSGSFTDTFANTSKINTSDSVNVEVSGGEVRLTRVSSAWLQTSQADFEAGVLNQVDTSSSPGNVQIAVKERRYNESEGESTTTSNTFQDKVVLTFTPSATKNYLIIASGLVAHASTFYATEVQLTIDGSVYAINEFQPTGAAGTNYYSFASQKVVSLGATSHTIKIQYRSMTSGQTAKIKNARIIALEIQDYQTAIAEAQSQTNSTSYQDKATLTFTPTSAGDYLIIATADLSASNTNYSALAQLTYDGASQGEMTREPTVASHFYTFGMVRELSLSAASHTFKIQYRSESSSYYAYIKNARITAVRLSDLGGFQYTESEAESYTSSTTYQDKTTLTFTPPSAQDYLIIASALVRQESTSYAVYTNLDVDGTSYAEKIYRPKDSTGYVPFFVIKDINLSAASHSIKIQYRTNRASTSAEAYIKNARIIAIPIKAYYSSGTIASQVLDTGATGATWNQLSWSETLQTSTDITFEVRTLDTSFAKDAGTPSWISVGGTSPVTSGLPSGRYMQWRATLSTSDTSKTPTLHDVTVTYNATHYNASGILRSVTIPQNTSTRLAVATQLSWTNNKPANTDVKYQLEYYNGAWALVPDTDLPGNSTGFGNSPVDISSVKTTYGQIRLRANLSTTDNTVTPTIQDWTVTYYYRQYSSPEPTVTGIGGEE